MCKFIIVVILTTITYTNCESSDNSQHPKIVGGEVTPTPHPHQISMQALNKTNSFSHFCGGSIIDNRTVLTAAHCMDGMKGRSIIIVAGTSDLAQNGSIHNVDNFIMHEDYNSSTFANDIAIVYVDKPFVNNDKIQPIPLETEEIGENVECILTGWGQTTNFHKILPAKLQRLEMKTMSNANCQKIWRNISHKIICTKAPITKGGCFGDSGGPLTKGDGKTLIGIVSFGAIYCGIGFPNAYTRVSQYINWIEKHMKSLE